MSRHSNHLPRWQRRSLYLSGIVLLASGLAWLALRQVTLLAGADALPNPLEAWLMKLHGLAAFGGLFMLGVLAGSHLPRGWRMSASGPARNRWWRQRRSGLTLCMLGAALALTGYLLYYFAPEALRPALGWLHSAIGVAMGGLVAMHRQRRLA